MIAQLRQLNGKPIFTPADAEFQRYARVITGYNLQPMLQALKAHTEIPEVGNRYEPSLDKLEAVSLRAQIEQEIYGGMPIQVGYCSGVNQQYNGMEYHKGSEVSINLDPVVMAFGSVQAISNNTFKIEDAQLFYLEAGTMIEIYATTLHLAPMRTSDDGFRVIVVLPLGTNTPLTVAKANNQGENLLLLEKNKWIMAHSSSERLIARGVHVGLQGENSKLRYH
jgi:Domain of unknown function (DUF4867)